MLGMPPALAQPGDAAFDALLSRVLTHAPLIDGHNDLPWKVRVRFNNAGGVDLRPSAAQLPLKLQHGEVLALLMTDIPRLRAGYVGAHFWSAWIPPTVSGSAAVKMALEQIDIVYAIAARYPQELQMAYSADDIVRAYKAGQIASLMGVEGGHQMDDSLAVLRQLFALGARYLTLTHTLNNCAEPGAHVDGSDAEFGSLSSLSSLNISR